MMEKMFFLFCFALQNILCPVTAFPPDGVIEKTTLQRMSVYGGGGGDESERLGWFVEGMWGGG